VFRRKKVEAAPEPKFEPIAYKLNWKPLTEIAVVVIDDSGKRETTVGGVLREAMPDRFNPDLTKRQDEAIPETEDRQLVLTIKKVAGGTIRVDSLDGRFGAELTERVLQLMRLTDGSLRSAQLFYYAHDTGSRKDTWWDEFRFFVVVGDAIVDENFELTSLCDDIDVVGTGVLQPLYDDDDAHVQGAEAWLKWWYRRFYTETTAGQLLLLREDRTPIHHYVSPERREAERDALLRRLMGHLGRVELVLVVVAIVWFLRAWLGGR